MWTPGCCGAEPTAPRNGTYSDLLGALLERTVSPVMVPTPMRARCAYAATAGKTITEPSLARAISIATSVLRSSSTRPTQRVKPVRRSQQSIDLTGREGRNAQALGAQQRERRQA